MFFYHLQISVPQHECRQDRVYRNCQAWRQNFDEKWRMTRKRGSLLGDQENVIRRKRLAVAAFQSLWSLWKRRQQFSEKLCLRLYHAFVFPVLTCNCGAWSINNTVQTRLDLFHRRQLRSLLGSKWPNQISSKTIKHDAQQRVLAASPKDHAGDCSDTSSACQRRLQPHQLWLTSSAAICLPSGEADP